MSELKAFVARKIDDGVCNPVPCVEVYLKSEADAYIKELEKKHKMEVEQLLIEIRRLENLCVSYRHDCDNLAIRENKQNDDWNRLCMKYNKLIKLKQDFCEKFKDIELELEA